MTMVTNTSPRAGAKLNRQQRRQVARLAKKGRSGNGAAAPANAALQEAVKLHKTGHPHEALQLYRKILADRPDQVDALNLGGVASFQSGHIAGAVQMLERAAALKPNDAEIHNNLGKMLQVSSRVDQAVAAHRRAIEIKPNYADAHYNLGLALQTSGKKDRAMAAYRQVLDMEPDHVKALNNLAILLREHGDPDQAIAACRRAIEFRPRLAPAYNNLANALSDLGRREEAVTALKQAVAIAPNFGGAHYNLAKLFYHEADLAPAASALETALRVEPGLALARFFLGVIYDQQGDEAAASDHFARLAQSPEDFTHMVDSWSYAKSVRGPATRFHADTFETLRFGLEEAQVGGMVLEFGVRFGKSINFIAQHTDRQVHGFDSFEGLPEAWDQFEAGVYSTGGQLPEVASNVRLHAGWFSDTLPAFVKEHAGPVRFMNVDCDIYSSTKTIFDLLADRIVPGTIIVFDEYLINPTWRDDEYKAFQEAVERHSWKYEYIAFNLFSKQAAVKIL